MHLSCTTRAAHAWALAHLGQRLFDLDAEQKLQQGNRAFAVGMQKAEVTRTAKALGQDMLEAQSKELCARSGTVLEPLLLGVAIAESHLAVLTGDDVLLLDDTAIQIAPEIHQGLLAMTDPLAVHDPLAGNALRQPQPCIGDGREQLAAEDFCQRLVVKQVAAFVFGLLGAPHPLVLMDGACRHHSVYMGMKIA